MFREDELIAEIRKHKADFLHFVDISYLSGEQNRGFPTAILFGMILSPGFLREITEMPGYVDKIARKNPELDEFHNKEKSTDKLADHISDYISQRGYNAFSQSEKNLGETGYYNEKTRSTPLPHKTIARMAGLGWIGKHNLLVTREYGSAVSMCTVLADVPLKTGEYTIVQSHCGNCSICVNVCSDNALQGNEWNTGISRDEIVNVNKCTTCLKCMIFCPWTQSYMKRNLQF